MYAPVLCSGKPNHLSSDFRHPLIASFGPVLARNSRYWVRIPAGSDVCRRDCAYKVFQTVQRPGVYRAVYGTVHYKEPFDKQRLKDINAASFISRV